jgi:hypothetical protein
MYVVDVDFVLCYVPPMLDSGRGIRLTRTIELPFPPAKHIAVFSKEWEVIEDPLGYPLKEITWDVDRNRFLANTESSISGTPIAMIPHELLELVQHGWRSGSYADSYSTREKRGRKRKQLPVMKIKDWDWDEAEAWETAPAKLRPPEFKTILHAVVSMMAELRNNCGVAYAMVKTGGYWDVPERSFPKEHSVAEKKFADAIGEFESMTFDQRWDWIERVQRRFPRLVDVVEAIQ